MDDSPIRDFLEGISDDLDTIHGLIKKGMPRAAIKIIETDMDEIKSKINALEDE